MDDFLEGLLSPAPGPVSDRDLQEARVIAESYLERLDNLRKMLLKEGNQLAVFAQVPPRERVPWQIRSQTEIMFKAMHERMKR